MIETPQQYIKRILSYQRGKNPLKVLASTPGKIEKLIRGVSRKQLTKRPLPNKWSVGEIIAHLADSELVLGYRMRMALSVNGTPIQAFDQDLWASSSRYSKLDPNESLEMYRILRSRNLKLLKIIPKVAWKNYGMHQERGKETITRMVELYAGHDINHLRQIEKIIKNKKS